MAKKIEVSRSEMLQMREQGLSNKDIANVLEISAATVFRYIGPQGGAHGEPGGF
jgi:predicted transcriptional regulator